MPTPQEAVTGYTAAWLESDEGRRRRLLEGAWTDEGTYTDPQSHAVGREALIALIGAFQQRNPGVRIVASSGADAHHDLLRFAWMVEAPAGHPMAGTGGFDVGELAPDGRLQRIIGFFGPFPSLPA